MKRYLKILSALNSFETGCKFTAFSLMIFKGWKLAVSGLSLKKMLTFNA